MASDGRDKALESTLISLNKRFGDGSIMKLGEATGMEVDVIPSGSLALGYGVGCWWFTPWSRYRNLRP